MAERTISPYTRPEEVIVDAALRPRSLAEMVGQDRLRDNLTILIQAALSRGEALDHVLLYGPPGLGKCITGSSLVLTDQGVRELRALLPPDLRPGVYAPLEIRVYGHNGPELTSHVYADGQAPTIQLRTQSGFELEGTSNHPVLVATPDGPRWRPLGELRDSDFVAIACGTRLWGKRQTIDFQPTYLDNASRQAVADERVLAGYKALVPVLERYPTTGELAEAYGTAIRHNPTPLVAARRLGLPLSDGRKVRSRRDLELPDLPVLSSKWQVPEVLDADLGYLMGLLIGDGHFERGTNTPAFTITTSDPEVQSEIVRICCEKFCWTPQVRQYGEKTPLLRFSQNFGHLMVHLGVRPVLAGEKAVPASVLASPEDVVRAFLQGLFDADGHAWRQEGYVDWSSKSGLMARQVQILLANLGIIAHRTSRIVRGETYWQLFIGDRDAVVFRERVGFRLSRKQDRLAGLEDLRRGASRSDLIPCAHVALRRLFDASRPHPRALHKRFDHVKRGDRLLSRSQIETYLNLLPDSTRTLPAAVTVAALCDTRYYWDRVAALEPGQAEVFDFCVPGSHSFVANGFFNHNTTLAHVISNEMAAGLKISAGPAIERAGDLAAILTNLRQGDVLFIDEVHRLGRAVEEVLYPAMEDFALDIVVGKGPSARNIRLKLPRFTLIGATTRLALMTAPLRSRFGAVYRFDFYEPEAMEQIVQRAANLLHVPATPDGVAEIARRGRGTPRVGLRLLRRVRDYAQVKADGAITAAVARDALALLEVDALGLDTLDRQVLGRLIRDFAGGPVGLETLSAALAEEPDTIMDVVEPYLLQLGFLDRTPRGRVATRRAYEHLGEPYPERIEQPALFNNDENQ